MKRKVGLFIVFIGLMVSCQSQNMKIDNSVVAELDIERYLGTWYEIARYDHSFERGMVGVTANYSWRDDGKIRVINKGFKETLDGKESIAEGKAKIPDPAVPAKLKVSFFWFFYGDYFVMELDEDYQWAVIGSKTGKYLWILARTPQIEDELYWALLKKLEMRGYETIDLIKVEQREKK